jgi:hypothetical protein
MLRGDFIKLDSLDGSNKYPVYRVTTLVSSKLYWGSLLLRILLLIALVFWIVKLKE